MISKRLLFKSLVLLSQRSVETRSQRLFVNKLQVRPNVTVTQNKDRTLPPLPHWESTPEDLKAATREIKRAIRARIEASGRSVEEVFAVVEKKVVQQVNEINADKERGETVWPVIHYADIENGTVPQEQLTKVKKRGCIVVRGHFEREQALTWDKEVVDYLDRNRFFEIYRGPADEFFSTVGTLKPEIYSIFWSKPHMEGRQSPRMNRVQQFINSFWKHSSGGVQWFDPDRDTFYPDRIRRRPPGTGFIKFPRN